MSNHSVGNARRIGAKSALLGFLVIFLLTEAIGLFQSMETDSGEGIRFFFEEQLNGLFPGVVIVGVAATFFLGRAAGRQILVDGRFPIAVAMLHALYTAIALLAFIFLYCKFADIHFDLTSSLIAILVLISGCIWLIAILNIRRAAR